MPGNARPWTQRETRLIAEYVANAHPGGTIVMRARVGSATPAIHDPTLSPREVQALNVWRRWVDALVLTPSVVHLYEAKIRLSPGALEQLDLYAKLFPLTPEYAQWAALPIYKHLVFAVQDPALVAIARERGVLVHEYHPEWVDEYLQSLAPRHQRAPQPRGLQVPLFPDKEGQ